ncbi:NUDIX domain-containing protein [Streptomyces sp. 142MFCol3.1]|uniref:NUDIX domain-containing protein n=1 Tax=Streptomyces sp. 142MFCol3.1 TaxID=1172179 RepID=UPI000564D70B|nr:NUDIX domain-containing protein [Streptomyces sp. 142MFCol3.1]
MNSRVRARVSAYALVVQDERLLLTRLSDASPVFAPGMWHLPGGGIDPGEQPDEALARELLEETGLQPADARLIDARSYLVHRNDVDWNLVSLFYAVTVKEGAARVVEVAGSTDQVRWIPLRDLRQAALTPAALDGLRMLRKGPLAAG